MPLMSAFVVVVGIAALLAVGSAVVNIPENQRGGLARLGRYTKFLSPGWHVRIPVLDVVTRVDLDASIPGWQGLSERELEAAVESVVTLGVVTRVKPGTSRTPSGSTHPGPSGAPALAAWLLQAASDQTGVDLSKDPMAKDRITKRAESAVAELRSSGSSEINLPFLTADAKGPKHFTTSLTRAQVEQVLGLILG